MKKLIIAAILSILILSGCQKETAQFKPKQQTLFIVVEYEGGVNYSEPVNTVK